MIVLINWRICATIALGEIMSDTIIEYIESRGALKNICNTTHDYNAIFPKDKFDFSDTDFEYYLYFDEDEARVYLLDFLRFINDNYEKKSFSLINFDLIMNEFSKYLMRHKVFFYNKTLMGLRLSANNKEMLIKTLQDWWGESNFVMSAKKSLQHCIYDPACVIMRSNAGACFFLGQLKG